MQRILSFRVARPWLAWLVGLWLEALGRGGALAGLLQAEEENL